MSAAAPRNTVVVAVDITNKRIEYCGIESHIHLWIDV